MANDIEVLFQYETENIEQVESCVKILMKKSQYRKYKEVYQIDLDILRKTIKDCDEKITEINNEITKKNKKNNKKNQNGGKIQKHIDEIEPIYLLIPKK